MAISAQVVKLRRQKLNKIENGIIKLQKQSREISLSKTSIQESVMFLGLVLGDLNEPTPYPESSNPDNKIIEDMADTSPSEYNFESEDHILMVKELRKDMEEEVENMKQMYLDAFDSDVKPTNIHFFPSHLIIAVTSLEKAKMWLGMELNSIKNEQKG